MNIYYLSKNPTLAARMLCDQHIVVNGKELVQVMVAVHRRHVPYFVLANSEAYPMHHTGHECVRWAGSSDKHYAWLSLHAMEVFSQHIERFGVPHKATAMFERVRHSPNLPHVEKYFDPPQVMPERYRGDNTVQAYRDYYVGEKLKFARWLHGDAPFWIPQRH